MKRWTGIILVIIALNGPLWAEIDVDMTKSEATEKHSLAIGFGLSESVDNFALNLELSSPTFGWDIFQVRAESQLEYLSAYRNDPNLAWEKFSSHRLGLAAGGEIAKDIPIRLYGEFGGLMVLPPGELSDDQLQWGIYSLFGFEFFITDSPFSYYLEAGSNSLFSEAENLPGSPDYYSGFTTRVGLRFQPSKVKIYRK